MLKIGVRQIAWTVLIIVMAVLTAPSASSAEPATGVILVDQGGVRAFPQTATTFQFTGLAADNQTVLFGPVSRPAETTTMLEVPVTVEILKIQYFDGALLVGLFEGYVTVKPAAATMVKNPPWVTQPPCHTPAPDEDGLFGAILSEFGQTGVMLALPPRALPPGAGPTSPSPLPKRVELTNLPPVGMQGTIGSLGSPGSCISWSFAYGLGSYTAGRNPDGTVRWDASEPRNQVSPAFLYALIHSREQKTCPSGSSEGYLSQLVLEGGPSVEQVPYAPDCCYINAIDVDHTFPMEGHFRFGSFASILLPATHDVSPAATLSLLKQFLAAGHAVAFAGPVFTGFSTPTLDHGVFYPTTWCESTPEKPCGHGMLLVGYDDDIGDPSKGKGAFLVQNSFGIHWPPASSNSPAPPGRFYLSYTSFLNSQRSAQVAYPLDTSTPDVAPLASSSPNGPTAYVTIGHQWVDEAPTAGTVPATLILVHRFSEPVTLESVTIAEPPPSTASATQSNGYAFSNGYTYLVRNDGYAFLPGFYAVTIVAKTSIGLVTYTGTAQIPAHPSWFGPWLPLATMPDQVTDSVGSLVNVER
jgi:hypothetical protein